MARPRSPFNHFPGPGSAAGPSDAPYKQQYTTIRARVLRVLSDRANSQPAFLLDVVPLVGGMNTGAPDGVISNVRILQAGFGSLQNTDGFSSGIVTLPEVGSVCLCIRDDSGWVAIGWYSGPVHTALETQINDPEHRAVSYNPGIETAGSRVTGIGGWDIPGWAFGIQPGDQLLGRGESRVKVTAEGVLIGSGADNMTLYRLDGARLQVVAEDEKRGVGFWHKRTYSIGEKIAANQYAQAKAAGGVGGLVEPPMDGSHYEAELTECAPLIDHQAPYMIRRRGHVSPVYKQSGRQAVTRPSPSGYIVTSERATDNYAVEKTTVVKPATAERPLADFSNELASMGFVTFDQEVGPDGSFYIRAGNPTALPGGESKEDITKLSFTFQYDAVTNLFYLRVGHGGDPIFSLVVNGISGAANLLMQGPLTATVGGPVSLTAPHVSVAATSVEITGNVTIQGNLTVTGETRSTGACTSQGVSLPLHTHTAPSGGGPTTPPV